MSFVSNDVTFRKLCEKLHLLKSKVHRSTQYLQWDDDHGDECIKRHLEKSELELLQKILQSPDQIQKHLDGETQMMSLRSIGDWDLQLQSTNPIPVHNVYHVPVWLEYANPKL